MDAKTKAAIAAASAAAASAAAAAAAASAQVAATTAGSTCITSSSVAPPAPAAAPEKQRQRARSKHKRNKFSARRVVDVTEEGQKPKCFPVKIWTRPAIRDSVQRWKALCERNDPVAAKYKATHKNHGFRAWRATEEKYCAELLFMKHPFSVTRFTDVPERDRLRLVGPDPRRPYVFPSLSRAACEVKRSKSSKPDSEWRTYGHPDLRKKTTGERKDVMFHEVHNQINYTTLPSASEARTWNTAPFGTRRAQTWLRALKALEDDQDEGGSHGRRRRRRRRTKKNTKTQQRSSSSSSKQTRTSCDPEALLLLSSVALMRKVDVRHVATRLQNLKALMCAQ